VERLLRHLGPDRRRFLLVRSRDRRASAALVQELLDRRAGTARVVLHPPDVDAPLYPLARSSPGFWKVLYAADVPGSVDLTARSMAAAHALITGGPNDLVVRMLWLPPSVLEGFAQLPATAESVLVIDDWHALVMDYLRGGAPDLAGAPGAEELDRLLCDAYEALSEAHLVVVTTGRAIELENVADTILDVRRVLAEEQNVEVRIVRDYLEMPPVRPYLLRLQDDGTLE
jgi:hypothetical protein